MSYQLCRWYDPYPRLAFALKLLYLSPSYVQTNVARELMRFMEEQWGMAQVRKVLKELRTTPTKGNRWYDEDHETAETVELMKNSPEYVKSRVADTLLEILMAQSA